MTRPTVVILDDDPTGTQTVQGVPVITRWLEDDVAWAFAQGAPGFFVLTNTRSLDDDEMGARNRDVIGALVHGAGGREFVVASRSDSTLRGHLPGEPEVIAEELALRGWGEPDAIVLAPAFPAAGRVTIDGVHRLRVDGTDVPVAETSYAQDATFGFRSSFLPDLLEERSAGRIVARDVDLVSLPELRGEAGRVARRVAQGGPCRYIAVDAETDEDLIRLSAEVRVAERAGARLLYRCSPGLVLPLLGLPRGAELTESRLSALLREGAPTRGRHGLVVVGSHVPLSTQQLSRLSELEGLGVVELDVERLVAQEDPGQVLAVCADELVRGLERRDMVLSTSRLRHDGRDRGHNLRIARTVSAALVSVTRAAVAHRRPAFVVAKGGITSSDIATEALGIHRAIVEGSVGSGIVWRDASSGEAVGIPYVLVPGNIGDQETLRRLVVLMRSSLGRSG